MSVAAQALSPPTTDERLKVAEIFYSLQGESTHAGVPTGFVRLVGCPLRCGYCDTDYAFGGGEWMSFDDIEAQISKWQRAKQGPRRVTVTGGEPLAQKPCLPFLTRLCDAGYAVSLETGGAHDIAPVDPRVERVVDLKTPGSGECSRNLYSNLQHLRATDQVKFVICDRDDYLWAKRQLEYHALALRCEVLFSPAWQRQDPTALADWILSDHLPVRLQLQLHKMLWGDVRGK